METDHTTETPEATTKRVTIRELQRHTSDVLEKVEANGQIYVTKHGRTIARILPPDPAEEQINAAIAAGVLVPRALTEPDTDADMLQEFSPESRSTDGPSLTEALLELREAEDDR
ncbi:type II toxin-antitoxin system Phd/YefM family antitoxin [Glycomyces tenuis]|uniref:type II toxin-antitoxin system Phd/YefM family antitoxin n=1 Tax=Glycomyces tenuis TaxID=58116 RepID=UPI000AEE1804|nr:type II toxin-antitoxin system prevent-host-death family antitoxin [Glycomyces tenuis]